VVEHNLPIMNTCEPRLHHRGRQAGGKRRSGNYSAIGCRHAEGLGVNDSFCRSQDRYRYGWISRPFGSAPRGALSRQPFGASYVFGFLVGWGFRDRNAPPVVVWATPTPDTPLSTNVSARSVGAAVQRFGLTLAANDWTTIFPFRTTNVSVANSYEFSAVSAVQRI
jgi:hypothetical protein